MDRSRSWVTFAGNPADRGLTVGLLLFAVAIGAIGIHRPMFIDEANSVLISSSNLSGVMALLRQDNNLPLYYVLLHWWMRCFGISEIATRAPSVFFYFLGILAAYKLGKQVSQDSRIGLYGAFFYGISLQAINLAQKVRMYSLLGLLAGLSTLFFFRSFWTHTSRQRDLVLYILVNILGSFTHVWFVFLLFAHLVCHLAFFPRSTLRRLVVGLLLSGIPFLLLWGPLLPQQMRNGATDWMPKATFWTPVGAVLEFYGGKRIGTLTLLACGLLLFAKEGGVKPTPAGEGVRTQWALLLIFALSIGVPLAVSVFKPIYWPGRYTIIALPSWAVLLAWRLGSTTRRPFLTGFAYAMMAVVLALHVVARRDMIENSEAVLRYSESDKRAAEELNRRIQPGDNLIFTGLSRASVEYYLRLFHRDRDVTLISFPAENSEHLGWDARRVDRAALETQARGLTERLSGPATGRPVRIWILPGSNPGANDILFNNLGRRFSFTGVLGVRGAFFPAIVVFQRTPNQSSGQH